MKRSARLVLAAAVAAFLGVPSASAATEACYADVVAGWDVEVCFPSPTCAVKAENRQSGSRVHAVCGSPCVALVEHPGFIACVDPPVAR